MSTAYLVAGVRTPFGRYGGALATVRPDDLAAHVLRSLTAALPSVDWAALDDVVLGCANQAGEDNRNVARMAALLAELPISVPGGTVNRLCGSGLDAVAIAARAVRAGDADLVIAGGVESMTRAPFVMPKAGAAWSRSAEIYDTTIGWRLVNPRMQEAHGTHSMPETAEIVAERHGISRADQDAFALRSQERAAKAIAIGRLAREIAPVPVPQRRGDPCGRPRRAPAGDLARGAGPAAPARPGRHRHRRQLVRDQRRRRRAAGRLGAGRAATTGWHRWPGSPPAPRSASHPQVMGIGPEPATRKLLDRTGLGVADLDVIELNEAFAVAGAGRAAGLGLPDDAEHVNPNGGAIALGHPLGASGARLALTAALELRTAAPSGP